MNRFFVFIACLVVFVSGYSQHVDSLITLTTNNKQVYEGRLLEDVKGAYVHMKLKGGNTQVFNYSIIREITNVLGEQLYFNPDVKPDVVAVQRKPSPSGRVINWNDSLYSADKDIAKWNKAWLIQGWDTIPVRVEPKKDYSISRRISTTSDEQDYLMPYDSYLRVIYSDDQLRKLSVDDISELVVLTNQTATRYIRMPDTAIGGLYKVIVEGKCQLICNAERFYGSTAAVGGLIGSMLSGMEEGKIIANQLFLYYDNILYDIGKGFKNKCRMAFAECPTIVQKIESREYTIKNIETVVNQFNTCISNKW